MLDGKYILQCTYIYQVHFVNISVFQNDIRSHTELYTLLCIKYDSKAP